mmetsp:Transcript_2293/g.4799  ORF Transcript_2293/g.4799 Transcript_2293/m.4799 type:complete len:206 (-) Transcript_2293:56-673(-)
MARSGPDASLGRPRRTFPRIGTREVPKAGAGGGCGSVPAAGDSCWLSTSAHIAPSAFCSAKRCVSFVSLDKSWKLSIEVTPRLETLSSVSADNAETPSCFAPASQSFGLESIRSVASCCSGGRGTAASAEKLLRCTMSTCSSPSVSMPAAHDSALQYTLSSRSCDSTSRPSSAVSWLNDRSSERRSTQRSRPMLRRSCRLCSDSE